MRIHFTLITNLLTLIIATNIYAAPGDTTSVYVHDKTDMVWYGGYNDMGYFPDGTTQYSKILMTYTMACASGGCSDWDYTTRIEAMIPTGTFDSTVTNVDTITLDTTWNVFEVINPYEMARVITPYAGYMRESQNGYTPNWEHDYVFDVTDFVHILKDSVQIRAFYEGWSTGFAATLRFDFIEGKPPRDIISIQNVYKGGGGYSTGGFGFEANQWYAKQVEIPANSTQQKLRVTVSGHGFDNSNSCAEFCIRDYFVNVNGTQVGTGTLWRDDCGFNPIYPQGGTWVYDRANWCPGMRAFTHEYDLTPYLTPGNTEEIDLDMESYFWGGTQSPSYGYSIQLVSYGDLNFANDAAITDIINPSTDDIHKRLNPSCGQPTITIRNEGSNTMTTADILYGVNGSTLCTYTWTGSLDFMEETDVTLPSVNWADYNTDNRLFSASIVGVNGISDENPQNNALKSTFDIPEDSYPSSIKVRINTNNRGDETGYTLRDVDSNVIGERATGSMSSNEQYNDDYTLEPGCYVLSIYDTGEDGLQWWANTSQGTGNASIVRGDVSITVYSFRSDFGSEVHHYFTIGDLAEIPYSGNCNTVSTEDTELSDSELIVQPNPNTGEFYLQLNDVQIQNAQLTVHDMLGKVVYQSDLGDVNGAFNQNIDLRTAAKGVYLVNVQHDEGQFSRKVIVQ